jgi:CheY-like chemotaxis protein
MSAKHSPLDAKPRDQIDFNEETILIVEDRDDDVQLLKTVLRLAKIANPAHIVRDGLAAKNYLEGATPYTDRSFFPLPIAVFVDLKMPRMNGFELLEWMKARANLCNVVRVIVTNSASPEDMDRAYSLGASFFVTKPAELRQMVKMMNCVMEWLRLDRYQENRKTTLNSKTL